MNNAMSSFFGVLIVFTPIIVTGCVVSSESLAMKTSLLICLTMCYANLYIQNVSFQHLLHQAFIFFLVHASFRSGCYKWRFMNYMAVLTMLLFRHLHNSCIFLWFNESPRNIDVDFLAASLLLTHFRPDHRKWLSLKVILLIVTITHFLRTDSLEESLLQYFELYLPYKRQMKSASSYEETPELETEIEVDEL